MVWNRKCEPDACQITESSCFCNEQSFLYCLNLVLVQLWNKWWLSYFHLVAVVSCKVQGNVFEGEFNLMKLLWSLSYPVHFCISLDILVLAHVKWCWGVTFVTLCWRQRSSLILLIEWVSLSVWEAQDLILQPPGAFVSPDTKTFWLENYL